MSKEMCCPNCGHKELQVTTEVDTKVTGKNYSAGNGCLGYLMFGPLGLLCGSCGQSQKVTTENTQFWVCSKCGTKFRSPEELRKEGTEKVTKAKGGFIIVAFFAVVILAILIYGMSVEPNAKAFFILFTFSAIALGGLGAVPIYMKKQGSEQLAEADELDSKMQGFLDGKPNVPYGNNNGSSNYSNSVNYNAQQHIVPQKQTPETNFYNQETRVYQPQKEENNWVCSCGSINEENANFCSKCGSKKWN